MSAVSTGGPPSASSGTPASITARASAAAASRSSSLTSGGAISAMVLLTGTSSPTRATRRRTVPASAASSVPAILSVSMSASSSPTLTSSPSATIQPVILPSCIDRPHLGMVTATIRSPVTGPAPGRNVAENSPQEPPGTPLSPRPPGHRLHGVGDALGVRDIEVLERVRERDRRVRRGHHLDRGLQRAERLLGHERRDVGGDRAPRVGLVHHHDPAGALDTLQHGVLVQRAGGAQVDHLALDPVGRELLGRRERGVHHP